LPTIKVEIDNEGKAKLLYEGFVGKLCFKEAERLMAGLKALGLDVDVQEVRETAQAQEQSKGRAHG